MLSLFHSVHYRIYKSDFIQFVSFLNIFLDKHNALIVHCIFKKNKIYKKRVACFL